LEAVVARRPNKISCTLDGQLDAHDVARCSAPSAC
jgi:sulfatase maturation enzyme AslB (radical SAM superfamily)